MVYSLHFLRLLRVSLTSQISYMPRLSHPPSCTCHKFQGKITDYEAPNCVIFLILFCFSSVIHMKTSMKSTHHII
jgi:hypothetical protein